MKKWILSICLVLLAGQMNAQKGFGLDGTLGVGFNGNREPINSVLLEGRLQMNDYFSTNLGVGLWYSAYSETWNSEVGNLATIYKLSDALASPSLQWSLKGQIPLGKLMDRTVKLFAEPRLYFLPVSGRTSELLQKYYDITVSNGETTYTARPANENDLFSYHSECHPRLYYGFQAGFSIEIKENFSLSASYGYNNIDFFKDLRNQTLNGFQLNDYLPAKGMQQISITLHYDYNLD